MNAVARASAPSASTYRGSPSSCGIDASAAESSSSARCPSRPGRHEASSYPIAARSRSRGSPASASCSYRVRARDVSAARSQSPAARSRSSARSSPSGEIPAARSKSRPAVLVGVPILGELGGPDQVGHRTIAEPERAGGRVVVGEALDEPRCRGEVRFERLRNARMRAQHVSARDVVDDRLPRDGVREPVAIARLARRLDEAGAHRGIHRLERDIDGCLADADHLAQVDLLAEHRGELEHRPLRRVERRDAGSHHVADGVGQLDDALAAPPLGLDDRTPHRPQEERIAARELAEHLGRLASAFARDAGADRDVVGDLVSRERGEFDPQHPAEPGERRERIRKRVRPVRRSVPKGSEEQQAILRRPLDHPAEQPDRRWSRPVQVVEHQHHGPRRGRGAQHVDHRAEHRAPGRSIDLRHPDPFARALVRAARPTSSRMHPLHPPGTPEAARGAARRTARTGHRVSSMHVPMSTAAPLALSRVQTSLTSRDLPEPGSPLTKTARPAPPTASAHAASSAATSSCRATNGGCPDVVHPAGSAGADHSPICSP